MAGFLGFKKISKRMTEEDETLKKAEESARRLEEAGYGKVPAPKALPPVPKKPSEEDYEESEKAQRFRNRLRKMLGQ